jgi:hypothetical protein
MMKIVMFAMAFLVGGVAFGQEKERKDAQEHHGEKKEKSTPAERATRLTNRMVKELALTAEQTQKISEINLGIASKNEDVRNNTTYTQEQKKEIVASNHVARKAMYKDVLTAEQFAKYEELEKKHLENKAAKKEEVKGKKGKATPAPEATEEDEL